MRRKDETEWQRTAGVVEAVRAVDAVGVGSAASVGCACSPCPCSSSDQSSKSSSSSSRSPPGGAVTCKQRRCQQRSYSRAFRWENLLAEQAYRKGVGSGVGARIVEWVGRGSGLLRVDGRAVVRDGVRIWDMLKQPIKSTCRSVCSITISQHAPGKQPRTKEMLEPCSDL